MQLLADALGWVGAVALLLAYALVSFRKLSVQAKTYQALNIFGSFLLIINTAYHHAYPSTAVNVIWILIAVVSLLGAGGRVSEQAK
jgi:hypothetical protein